MAKIGDRLLKIRQEAEEREEEKRQEWVKSRKIIRKVLSEIESSLENSEAKERNGNSNSLSYRLNDTVFILQFSYNQSQHIVSRHDYGIGQPRDYDLGEITINNIEAEVEEFVQYVHNRLR